MNNYISFFGSNSRKLYVKNIYECLALPDNHVIQYRYRDKYVDKDIIDNRSKYIGRKGIIFYYYRFDNEGKYKGKISTGKDSIAIPIREVKIIDIKIMRKINHINFFLELGDFIKIEDFKKSNPDESLIGEKLFVKELKFEERENVKWIDKIEEVKDYFKETEFFHISSITTENDQDKSEVNYHPTEYKTNLHLFADSSYIFEFLTYNNSDIDSPLTIHTDESYIKVNDELEKGTLVNSKKIKFLTRPIDYKEESTYINIKESVNEFSVSIPVSLEKKIESSILFALASTLLLISIPVINLYGNGKLNTDVFKVIAVVSFFLICASGYLHRNYNKK